MRTKLDDCVPNPEVKQEQKESEGKEEVVSSAKQEEQPSELGQGQQEEQPPEPELRRLEEHPPVPDSRPDSESDVEDPMEMRERAIYKNV